MRDYGGAGPPAIIIPSLINPPSVLDLDPEVSFAAAVGGMGRRALLLDWGDARERSGLSVGGHVEQLLLPLLAELAEPAALIGYCLGGTMAIAAANLSLCERVVTLAAPWHFAGYGDEARSSLEQLWRRARGSAVALGVLPMEVLQAAFWSLDPQRTVRKYARFGELPEESPEARRFVALEDWANDGEPVPYPAARELLEDFFSADLPGRGEWRVGGAAISDSLAVPATHFAASRDRITPSTAAPSGDVVPIDAGHVGMVVGGARELLHAELASFLDPACR